MNVFKKNIHNILFLIAIVAFIYLIYNLSFGIKEGNKINNDCFTSGKGIGCHNFYKSKLPVNGDYTNMYKECIAKNNDTNCKLCVQATATLDKKSKNKRMNISDRDMPTFKEMMSEKQQNCKLTDMQLKLLNKK